MAASTSLPTAPVALRRSRLFLLLGAGLAAAACSAGPDADDGADGPPDFSGVGPGGAGQGGAPAAGASGSAPGGTGGIAGSSAGSSGAPAAGSGGSAAGAGGTAAAGTGGTAAGAGGAGQAGAQAVAGQGGSSSTPPLGEGVYFADDFEAGIDPAWRNTSNGGSIVQDTTRGANGTTSSIRVDGTNQFHTMLQFALPEAVRTANQLYGRVHLRVDQAPGQGHYVWVEAGSLVGDFLQGNDQNEMRIGSNLGLLQVNHYGGPPGGDQDIRDQDRRLLPGDWHCLQFFMNGNPEELQVFFDGEETALSTTNFTAQRPGSEGNGTALTDWMPPLDAIRFGWELSGATIWYDEVVLADALPACE